MNSGNNNPKTAALLKKMQGMEVTADGTLKQNGQALTQSIPDSIPVYVNGVLTHSIKRVSAGKVRKISIERTPGGTVETMRVYISRMEVTGPDSAGKKVINLVTTPVK